MVDLPRAYICLFGLILISFLGCSKVFISLFGEQNLSENYALIKNGAVCTCPKMADGNMNTMAPTEWLMSKSGESLEEDLYTGADVILPERKMINRVVIYNDGRLQNCEIYADVDNEWKLLKQVKYNKSPILSVITSVYTDKIRIKVRRKAKISGGGVSGGATGPIGRDGSFFFDRNPMIKEIELYSWENGISK